MIIHPILCDSPPFFKILWKAPTSEHCPRGQKSVGMCLRPEYLNEDDEAKCLQVMWLCFYYPGRSAETVMICGHKIKQQSFRVEQRAEFCAAGYAQCFHKNGETDLVVLLQPWCWWRSRPWHADVSDRSLAHRPPAGSRQVAGAVARAPPAAAIINRRLWLSPECVKSPATCTAETSGLPDVSTAEALVISHKTLHAAHFSKK